MNTRSTWGVASLLLLLLGCKSNHLVFLTYTKVGLDISSVDAVPTSAMFGYKRFEGAIIPVDVGNPPDAADDAELPEVASVYAALKVKNSWLKGLDIYQVFATGDAAEEIADDGGAYLSAVLKNLEDGESAKKPDAPGEAGAGPKPEDGGRVIR